MKQALAVGLAGLVVVALGPAVAGATASAKRPPVPCSTFTVANADKLFGIAASMMPKEKSSTTDKGTSTEIRNCKVTTGKDELNVKTSFVEGGVGGPFTIYQRPKLGNSGEVLVSTTSTFPETVAMYERNDVFFSDVINRIVKHKGNKLYKFALKQSKAYAKTSGGS